MEVVRFPSRGGFSVRSIFIFALTVVITALLLATSSSTTTHAQASNATWTDGGTILYDGHGFNAATDITDPTGTIPSGAKIYKSAVQAGTGTTSSKIFIIYFSSGVDPPTATSARYVEFNYSGGTLSNAQNARDITTTPQGSNDSLSGEVESSCSVGGIGWIICPVSVFLAEAMDNLFNILAGMIAVQPPILGDENNSMYVAWNVMRSIANIAFVIVFLIIIFSQVTSTGVSNYGLKRLVPRLIIAAVLVNISFFVAAAAIDISNIAGYSVQSIFNGIRENLFHVTNDDLSGVNTNTWSAVTAIILAGGGMVGGVYYMATGGLYLLVPLLIGLALTVLFVVIVFAARQAIILILVIVAPLAFVANLLPNTEKWFEKWKDLFFTMLIFFPAFALVFGGSQLAGQIIIQNAGDNVVSLLFGMAVQVAPLVITPLILKLSGGLLGRIAQITNNPRKGAIDRSRNWAEKRAEHAKQQNMARGARWYNPASYGAGMVRRADYRKRRLSDNTEIWKQAATNRYEETAKYGDIAERREGVDTDKKTIHAHHARHIDTIKAGKSTTDKYNLYGRAINAQSEEERAETAKNEVSTHYNDLRVRGSSALRSSSYNLEMSKVRLEGSDTAKNAYYTNQKATSGTRLNALVEEYETTKVRLEGAQSRYTTMVDGMKIDPRSTLNGAIQTAQSAKQQSETAQVKLQAYFDAQNKDKTTVMGASYVELERAKVVGEGVKADLAGYTADIKTNSGPLHVDYIETQRLTQAKQLSETRLGHMVEKYKSGAADMTGLSLQEQTIIERMVRSTEELAAEAQGTQAAQNIQKKQISEAFTQTFVDPTTGRTQKTARAEELLTIAKSVDEYGDVRAEAGALATLEDITNKARTANQTLLEERAVAAGLMPKDYAVQLLENRADKNDMSESEDLIRAAMEIAGNEAQIPVIRKMRKSKNFNQDHLTAMLLRNSGTMKVKGGFDLQADPGLIHASDELMDASIAGTLGSTAAEQFKDLKNGAIKNYAANMEDIIAHTQEMETSRATDPAVRAQEQGYGARGIEGIQKTYFNLTLALNDPQMVRALGDNLIPAIQMHQQIHANPRFHNDAMKVDYGHIDPQNLSGYLKPQDLGEGLIKE